MDEVGGFLFYAAIVIGVVVFVTWVILAILMRVLAILVVYWAGSFAVGLLVGILGGLVIPIRVLRGHAKVQPVIATPQDVVANKVMATKARGAAKNFGWDHAWPVYNPYQAKNDARAVVAETNLIVRSTWTAISPSNWSSGSSTAAAAPKKHGLAARVKAALTSLPGIAWLTFAAVPVGGAFLGIWISIVFWLAAMAIFGGAVYLCQQAWVVGYRWFDRLSRKKDRASLRCAKCYRETTMPSYQCPNPSCGVVHRDISPGPLGMMHRRCACGAGFPTTVSAAAKKLQAVCPYCGEGVAEGSATRRTIQLPTIGAIAVGKTRFLAAAATTLNRGLAEQGGALTPLTAPAASFLQLAHDVMSTGRSTAKTQLNDHPEALPYKLETGSRRLELHFIDAAGESFRSMDTTQSLGYIDTADVLLLVLDPLGLPGIYEEAVRAGLHQRLEIATSDQEDAYGSAIDRLRSENVKLKQRHLGVVITKLDVLQGLPSGSGMTPGNSLGIRQWLIGVGQDGLVRRLEDDFDENITYFGVDLMRPCPTSDPMHPIHVCQWVLDTSNTKIVISPSLLAAAADPA
ncbi:hypothetical protein A5746_12950 [Mycolicibacterium conceptionense]|uniref:TRAFAC clade GTPase domain-containing protein n=1 Tax=Mycolicibacterium conceptionense TaxID=451644 RepID=UPI0007EC5E24|nr:hypothetical protein [Mycolicibacterium conceptionense]OBJ98314.1 hypothetical protein A5639_29495 [Mycolicibacterium conceptionense]OMB86005.1 hypothetical protein A5741_18130 [Mycolicibacterium conceptionense]OMB99987.1 hypothetical protein A5746_12950 [Mycolicibacterium conceptionense]